MARAHRGIALAALAALLAAPAAGEPDAGAARGPLRLRLDVDSARPAAHPAAPDREGRRRAIGAGALPAPREAASLDARYELALGRTSRLGLRYRGTFAREGAREPRDRQRHAPELRLRKQLGAGCTARLGWRTRAEWREGRRRSLRLDGHGFAELELALGGPFGRTRIRYEHRRPDLLEGGAEAGVRHRASLRQSLPRIELPEGLALELRPSVALDAPGSAADRGPEVLDAALGARLESHGGPSVRAQLGYARRRLRSDASTQRASELRAETRLELPLRDGLRLGLELGWEGRRESAASARRDTVRAHAGLDWRF